MEFGIFKIIWIDNDTHNQTTLESILMLFLASCLLSNLVLWLSYRKLHWFYFYNNLKNRITQHRLFSFCGTNKIDSVTKWQIKRNKTENLMKKTAWNFSKHCESVFFATILFVDFAYARPYCVRLVSWFFCVCVVVVFIALLCSTLGVFIRL